MLWTHCFAQISWEADLLRPSSFSLRGVRARSSNASDISRIVDQHTVAVNYSRNARVELFMRFFLLITESEKAESIAAIENIRQNEANSSMITPDELWYS
jgi:hypothetical protein